MSMAYSDYGGYAYKNGERVVERSDAVMTPEGLKSTPGAWPGWLLEAGRNGGSYHVILGDEDVYVTLYKQSYISVVNLKSKDQKTLDELLLEKYPQYATSYKNDAGQPYFDGKVAHNQIISVEVGGHLIEIYREESDNYYQYIRLTQPNEDVWTGFSGYGVGAGLEDCGYGFSTSDQEKRLNEIFPVTK